MEAEMHFSIDMVRECLLASLTGAGIFVVLASWVLWSEKRATKRATGLKGTNGEGI